MSSPCTFAGCNKSFSSRFSMQRHRTIHEDKQFACPDCDKRFGLAQYLKEHALTHTGERPFKCSVNECGKSFRQSGKLSIHMKKHHTSWLRAFRSNNMAAAPKSVLQDPKKHKLDDSFASNGEESAAFELPSRKRQASKAMTPAIQTPSSMCNSPRFSSIESMISVSERILPLPVQLLNSYIYSDNISSLSHISPELSAFSSPSLCRRLNLRLGNFGQSPVSPFACDMAYQIAASGFATSSMFSAASALATLLSAQSQVRQNMLAEFHRLPQRVSDNNFFSSSSYQYANPAAYLTQRSDFAGDRAINSSKSIFGTPFTMRSSDNSLEKLMVKF